MSSSSLVPGHTEKRPPASSPKQQGPESAVAQSLNKMAFSLLGSLLQGRDKVNVLFSPICLATELACLVAGSEGATRQQLQAILNLELSELQKVIDKFKTEMAGHSFYAAQKICVDDGVPVLEPFRRLVEERYMTAIETVNFKDPRHEYVSAINEWSHRCTVQKIPSVVSSRTLRPSDASILLVSSVFFKGLWKEKFCISKTQQSNFFVRKDRDPLPVRMMIRSGRYGYAEFPQMRMCALEVPYRGANATMVILLPNEVGGLASIEESFIQDPSLVEEVTRQLRPRANVRLGLPKFVSRVRSKLRDVLEGLGAHAAFSKDGAQFLGISGHKGLFVTNIIHVAMLEVSEDGHETRGPASLVSGVVSKVAPPTPFIVDRPFLFYIRSVATNVIFFLGSIQYPEFFEKESPEVSIPPSPQ